MQEEPAVLTFEDLYETYGERILNLAYRMTGSEDAAHDLMQDIFIKVYENLATFKHKSHVYTWIYRIAVNHIYNYLKKERRRKWLYLLDKNVSEILREEDIEPTFKDQFTEASPQSKLEASQRDQIVWSAIQSLPTKYRVPLVLFHYERMSYKEIAGAMSLSISAVEARIHRAKKQLIKQLEPWIAHI